MEIKTLNYKFNSNKKNEYKIHICNIYLYNVI